jgi:hypothetical protein
LRVCLCAAHDRCLNSARAAAACRSVRHANAQLSLRLQVSQMLGTFKHFEPITCYRIFQHVCPCMWRTSPCWNAMMCEWMALAVAWQRRGCQAAPLIVRVFEHFSGFSSKSSVFHSIRPRHPGDRSPEALLAAPQPSLGVPRLRHWWTCAPPSFGRYLSAHMRFIDRLSRNA